jgi:hypothetical protein
LALFAAASIGEPTKESGAIVNPDSDTFIVFFALKEKPAKEFK